MQSVQALVSNMRMYIQVRSKCVFYLGCAQNVIRCGCVYIAYMSLCGFVHACCYGDTYTLYMSMGCILTYGINDFSCFLLCSQISEKDTDFDCEEVFPQEPVNLFLCLRGVDELRADKGSEYQGSNDWRRHQA